MATHSSILAWKIPWTEEPGGLRSMGPQRVRHNWATNNSSTFFHCCCSVPQWCLTLCDPIDCSTAGFPVLRHLLEFAPTHVHWCHTTISSSVVSFSSCLQYFPASGSFQMSQLFALDGQSIGASVSASQCLIVCVFFFFSVLTLAASFRRKVQFPAFSDHCL